MKKNCFQDRRAVKAERINAIGGTLRPIVMPSLKFPIVLKVQQATPKEDIQTSNVYSRKISKIICQTLKYSFKHFHVFSAQIVSDGEKDREDEKYCLIGFQFNLAVFSVIREIFCGISIVIHSFS